MFATYSISRQSRWPVQTKNAFEFRLLPTPNTVVCPHIHSMSHFKLDSPPTHTKQHLRPERVTPTDAMDPSRHTCIFKKYHLTSACRERISWDSVLPSAVLNIWGDFIDWYLLIFQEEVILHYCHQKKLINKFTKDTFFVLTTHRSLSWSEAPIGSVTSFGG